jgi:hypothetical protein
MVRPKRDVGPFSYETIIVPWADYDSKTVDDDR